MTVSTQYHKPFLKHCLYVLLTTCVGIVCFEFVSTASIFLKSFALCTLSFRGGRGSTNINSNRVEVVAVELILVALALVAVEVVAVITIVAVVVVAAVVIVAAVVVVVVV